jgi:hypothetical protein
LWTSPLSYAFVFMDSVGYLPWECKDARSIPLAKK